MDRRSFLEMARKRILIVDDEVDIINTIKLFLEIEGYDIIIAFDGREALDKVRSENPELIILDVMLPSIDGFEIAQKLKSDARYKHIPILIVTAFAQRAEEELAKKSLADSYMTKPLELDVLNDKVKELLSRRRE